MSNILSNNIALTVFKMEETAAITLENLRKYAFRSIDSVKDETKAWGWCSIEDMADTDFLLSPPSKGEFMFFALRVDKRNVPAALLKKHVAEAFKEENAKNKQDGKSYISRKRKKELKELHKSRLLSQMEPVPSAVDVVVDMQAGLAYLCTSSRTVCAIWCEHMQLSFGVSPQAMHSVHEDVPALFKSIYEQSRDISLEAHTYTVAETGQLTLARAGGTDKSEVSIVNEANSVKTSIEAGLTIKKFKLQMERQGDESLKWEFVLSPTLCFLSLKPPKVDKQKGDDPDAILLEKAYLLGQAVGVVRKLFEVTA